MKVEEVANRKEPRSRSEIQPSLKGVLLLSYPSSLITTGNEEEEEEETHWFAASCPKFTLRSVKMEFHVLKGNDDAFKLYGMSKLVVSSFQFDHNIVQKYRIVLVVRVQQHLSWYSTYNNYTMTRN